MRPTHSQTVLLVGASSGIGKSAAQLFAREGYTVYGASRRGIIPGTEEKTLIPLVMDAGDTQSVQAGVERIIRERGRIDILIYAAGNGLAGPAECSTPVEAREQFEINFHGALRLINAVLPHMRAMQAGHMLFVGSVGGIFPVPYQLLYSASKSALAIYVEGLRLECKPFHVRAAIIEPGDVQTGFTDARKKTACVPQYREAMERAVSHMERDERNGMPPEAVARALLRAAKRKNPPARMVVGAQYRLFAVLKRILPKRLVEWLLYKIYLG